jgi:hypothetical protein
MHSHPARRKTRWPSEQELAKHLADIAQQRLEARRTYKSRKQREQELKEVGGGGAYTRKQFPCARTGHP